MTRWMWVVWMALATSACGDGRGPIAPSSDGARAGVWTGTLASAGRRDDVRLDLIEERIDAGRSLLRGSWSVTADDSGRTSGVVIGTISGASGTLTLTPQPTPTCATPPALPAAVGTYIVSALGVGADSLRGAYQVSTCQGVEAGTLDVRR